MIDPLGFGDSDKPHARRGVHVHQARRPPRGRARRGAHRRCACVGLLVRNDDHRGVRPTAPESHSVNRARRQLPGLTGVDRENLSGSSVDAFRSGDWSRVWTEILPFVPTERRLLFTERNDLLACAASEEGSFESLAGKRDPMPPPMLCYVGTGEGWWEAAREVTESAGGRFTRSREPTTPRGVQAAPRRWSPRFGRSSRADSRDAGVAPIGRPLGRVDPEEIGDRAAPR